MEFNIPVDVHENLVDAMGEDKVKSVLTGFLDNMSEEILKEAHEDKTGEWIKT